MIAAEILLDEHQAVQSQDHASATLTVPPNNWIGPEVVERGKINGQFFSTTPVNPTLSRLENRLIMHPKKWNVVCWVLLLLWLVPSALMNIPFNTEITEPTEIELPGGRTAIAYDQVLLIGWPFTFLEVSKPPNKAPLKSYRISFLVLNLLLIAATLIGIVCVIQTLMPKFSIRTMLIGVTGFALLIALAQFVFSTDNYHLQTGFMLTVYFSPLIAIIPVLIYSQIVNRKLIAG